MRLSSLGILILLGIFGCNADYNAPTSPNEQWIASVIMNECAKLGVDVRVDFESEDRFIDGDYTGYDEPLMACMAATPDVILVYPTCVDRFDDLDVIRPYARHECCHAYLGHVSQLEPDKYIAQEIAADQCVAEMF